MKIQKVLALALVACVPLAVASGCSKAAEPVITQAEYDQIKEGMTLQGVEAIIGTPGELRKDDTNTGAELQKYTWKNDEKNGAMIGIYQGKVEQKAILGELP